MVLKTFTYLATLLLILPVHAQFQGGTGDGAGRAASIQLNTDGQMMNALALFGGGKNDGHDQLMITSFVNGQQVSVVYGGGYNDGHSVLKASYFVNGNTAGDLYAGGQGDGFDLSLHAAFVNGDSASSIYSGGSDDGHSVLKYASFVDGQELEVLFSGGVNDGFDVNNLSAFVNGNSSDVMFSGGINDGHAVEDHSSFLNGTESASIYSGGVNDGHSKNTGSVIIISPECTIVVNTDDDGFGSLRYALSCASPGDTITFKNTLFNDTITLSSTQLEISQQATILVNGGSNLTVDATGINRALKVQGGQTAIISGLKLVVGTSPTGNGIENNGILTLIDVTIYDHGITPNNSIIKNNGQLTIKGTLNLIDQ